MICGPTSNVRIESNCIESANQVSKGWLQMVFLKLPYVWRLNIHPSLFDQFMMSRCVGPTSVPLYSPQQEELTDTRPSFTPSFS